MGKELVLRLVFLLCVICVGSVLMVCTLWVLISIGDIVAHNTELHPVYLDWNFFVVMLD